MIATNTNAVAPAIEAPPLAGAPRTAAPATHAPHAPYSLRRHDAATVSLPGGYVAADGTTRHEVELVQLTGAEEYRLAHLDPQTCRASLVTELLAGSIRGVGPVPCDGAALARGLLIGDRDYLVLKLRELTLGRKVRCVLGCPAPDCGKRMDLAFESAALGFNCAPVGGRYFTADLPGLSDDDGDSLRVEFRLPTGADQEAAAALYASDPRAAYDELLARCLRRVGECEPADSAEAAALLSGAARAALEQRMEELTPSVEIDLEAQCPECGFAFETRFDFVAFFFEELKQGFRTLEREVHFLAWHYHWAEHDILAMPRAKRLRYVALLEKEVDRLNHVW